MAAGVLLVVGELLVDGVAEVATSGDTLGLLLLEATGAGVRLEVTVGFDVLGRLK